MTDLSVELQINGENIPDPYRRVMTLIFCAVVETERGVCLSGTGLCQRNGDWRAAGVNSGQEPQSSVS